MRSALRREHALRTLKLAVDEHVVEVVEARLDVAVLCERGGRERHERHKANPSSIGSSSSSSLRLPCGSPGVFPRRAGDSYQRAGLLTIWAPNRHLHPTNAGCPESVYEKFATPRPPKVSRASATDEAARLSRTAHRSDLPTDCRSSARARAGPGSRCTSPRSDRNRCSLGTRYR